MIINAEASRAVQKENFNQASRSMYNSTRVYDYKYVPSDGTHPFYLRS